MTGNGIIYPAAFSGRKRLVPLVKFFDLMEIGNSCRNSRDKGRRFCRTPLPFVAAGERTG
jgi:hypothetical protein